MAKEVILLSYLTTSHNSTKILQSMLMLMDNIQRILNISFLLNIQLRPNDDASNFILNRRHGIQGTGQRMNAGIAKNADHLQLIQRIMLSNS